MTTQTQHSVPHLEKDSSSMSEDPLEEKEDEELPAPPEEELQLNEAEAGL